MVIAVILVLRNTKAPIVVVFSGTTMLPVKAVLQNKSYGRIVNCGGMLHEVRDVVPQKTPSPSVVIEFGNVTLVIFVSLNARYPIVVIPSGMTISPAIVEHSNKR